MSESYTYTNWRGKTFLIDDAFAKDFQETLLEDGCDKEYCDTLTPEKLMEMLPDMERWEREDQLEAMWDQLNA